MRRFSENNFEKSESVEIFDIQYPNCGNMVEFSKDKIKRNYPQRRNHDTRRNKIFGLRVQQGQVCR